MAKYFEGIKGEYKNVLKKNNTNDHSAKCDSALDGKDKEWFDSIEKPNMDVAKVSGSRELWTLWFALLTVPLLIFDIFLFCLAIVFIWTIF